MENNVFVSLTQFLINDHCPPNQFLDWQSGSCKLFISHLLNRGD